MPFVGAIIGYGFLFGDDAAAGKVSGKGRPCLIVHVDRTEDRCRVLVCPITHTAPRVPERSVPLDSANVRRRAGLDERDQWVLVSETNEFDWPAFEIVYTSRGERYYGELDRPLVVAARIGVADAADAGERARVHRP